MADSGPTGVGVYLYWIPLGAGGSGFVRMNGRIYEAIEARLGRRGPLDLVHTAMEVNLPEGRYVVETVWPSPEGDPASRGVVVTAPVFARWLSFTRLFRYELRCWRDGDLPDSGEALGGARTVSTDPRIARRVLELTASVPPHIWGRDATHCGDMWNSNSVISWLLAAAGVHMTTILPPVGTRAPGWEAGVTSATRHRPQLVTNP